jgi:Zn-dependent M28 family amino/carboxypeptidase
MVNLIAEIPGIRRDVIVLGGHYDTKYYPDVRFVGANDGGSGTALLLELARVLAERAREYTVWVVFFDGEEDRPPTSNNAALHGSVHFVQEAARTGDLSRLRAAVVLDMVGDRELDIHPDSRSTAWMNAILWATARQLGHDRHFPNDVVGIIDDHEPLLRAGIPAALLIDYRYGPTGREFWHTPQDTLDKVSRASLQIVGDVVLRALPEIERTLQTQATPGPR